LLSTLHQVASWKCALAQDRLRHPQWQLLPSSSAEQGLVRQPFSIYAGGFMEGNPSSPQRAEPATSLSDGGRGVQEPPGSAGEREGVSRREFLAATAAAGAAAGLAACSQTASTSTPAIGKVDTTPAPASPHRFTLHINDQDYPVELEPRVSLLDALREHLGLTGTKKGCDHGQCGACTVLINGQRHLSCLTLAIMHQNDRITTIEGLAKGDELHPVQAAFIEHDAFQCGYCTPGQICSAVGLIHEGHAKTDDEIREAMAGNICRCGAYPNIVAAIKQAMA
jgi:xanthine dehydrogenase YagT iron-sulfur-binding subunit